MLKTVKARITHGRIEPLEPLPFIEGAEAEVTAPVKDAAATTDPTRETEGAWEGLLDCEQFEKDVYEGRLTNVRPDFSL